MRLATILKRAAQGAAVAPTQTTNFYSTLTDQSTLNDSKQPYHSLYTFYMFYTAKPLCALCASAPLR